MNLLFFTSCSKITSCLKKLLVWSWIVLPQKKITFQEQDPCIKTCCNLMHFPFSTEVFTPLAARLGVSRTDQGCACLVLGFCSAWSIRVPFPPAFTHSLSKADIQCRNKCRKLTLWGRKCHIRFMLGLPFDKEGSWKMAWEIRKEWEWRKGKSAGTWEWEKG